MTFGNDYFGNNDLVFNAVSSLGTAFSPLTSVSGSISSTPTSGQLSVGTVGSSQLTVVGPTPDCTFLPADVTADMPLCHDWEEKLCANQDAGYNLDPDLMGLPLSRNSCVSLGFRDALPGLGLDYPDDEPRESGAPTSGGNYSDYLDKELGQNNLYAETMLGPGGEQQPTQTTLTTQSDEIQTDDDATMSLSQGAKSMTPFIPLAMTIGLIGLLIYDRKGKV